MNKLQTVHIIGCGVLAPDIQHLVKELECNHNKSHNFNLSFKTTTFLPGGLHDKPNELRLRLQSAIDNIAKDKNCSRIVIGYGLCGRGTVGINAPPDVYLVFPKVHDCIALFMGSDIAYKNEFAKYPGTYYLSAGWCIEKGTLVNRKHKIWIGSESMGCLELKEKYGEEGGKKIIDFFSSWQKNYQRAAFIDTGIGNFEKYAEQAQDMAKEHNWKYERIKGDRSLMIRLLTQDYSDDSILVVPPLHSTIYSAFTNSLDSAPAIESVKILETNLIPDSVGAILNEPIEHYKNNKEDGSDRENHYGLGIDAGGTYTDAVIYDFNNKKIVQKNKALTTKWDFSIGINNVLSGLNQEILSKVNLVSVSTTLATNAIVEGGGQKTGLILMNSAGLVSDDLIAHIPKKNIKGYININGEEVEPVDQEEVRKVVKDMIQNQSVTAFAVSGFGGAINPSHELIVKKIIEKESGMVVCCGHELSDLLNFVVRAQTAVLNARIIPRMVKFFSGIDKILEKRGVSAPIMVVKGDGTLISSNLAKERPIETVLSGPAASVTGAKILTGLSNAIIVDMGGTTTDTADICDNMAAVCESGANVGGFATHVKALDMRTIGLGGDSLIRWKKGEFIIGPRRVGPIVWAGSVDSAGVEKALFYMEQRQLTHLDQVIFIAANPINNQSAEQSTSLKFDLSHLPFKPTEQEIQIYNLLSIRPHTPEELASALNSLSTLFLPMDRLEESGVVQRCGLTPTDLLHVKGDFKKWNLEPAKKLLSIISNFTKKSVLDLIDELLEKIERDLALELLKSLIFHKNQIQESGLEKSPLAKHLISNMLGSSLNSRYQIKAEFKYPIIGIGAPIHYFLPKACKILNTDAVIPQNADVANAVGAITSSIMVKQKVVIRPDSAGRFVLEGVVGNNSGFTNIKEAQLWAVEQLKKSVREEAVKAGTSTKEVLIDIDDRIINTGNGLTLFIDKTITATLTGNPDIAATTC